MMLKSRKSVFLLVSLAGIIATALFAVRLLGKKVAGGSSDGESRVQRNVTFNKDTGLTGEEVAVVVAKVQAQSIELLAVTLRQAGRLEVEKEQLQRNLEAAIRRASKAEPDAREKILTDLRERGDTKSLLTDISHLSALSRNRKRSNRSIQAMAVHLCIVLARSPAPRGQSGL